MGTYLLLLLISLAILDKTPQHSHLLMEVLRKIKAILFGQSQLTVVVVQTLLADAQHPCCFLQVDLLPCVIGLGTAQVQSPPSLHQFDGFQYCPLPTPHVPSLATIRLKLRSTPNLRILLDFLAVAEQNDGRLEEPLGDKVSVGGQFAQGDKGIGIGVVQ